MPCRRGLLLLGVTVFVLLALQPTWAVCAGGPVDVEASGYGGSVPTHLACGPDVRLRYGGGGGLVGAHLGRAGTGADAEDRRGVPEGTGFFVGAGGAAEYVAPSLIACDGSKDCTVPAPYGQGVLVGRVGYDWHPVGIRVGGLVSFNQDGSRFFPDLSLRLGATNRIRVMAGLGSYDVATMLRPGGWIGLVMPLGAGWDVALHTGAHGSAWIFGNPTLGGSTGYRTQVAVRMPLDKRLWLQLGEAVWVDDVGWGPETSAGLGGSF
jgi:hypothetical protein